MSFHPFEPFACACPECGWDDGGELQVRDWYDDVYPPIPRPRNTLHVIGDPEHGRRPSCPVCGAELEPETVARRAARGDRLMLHRSSRPVLLDLYSCAGGAAKGYHDAGFDVVGVDHVGQPRYPFDFVQHDAIKVLENLVRDGHALGRYFDAIHASPPCQSYLNLGKVNEKLGRDYTHPDLVAATRELLEATGLPYVIENVENAPLRDPVRLCGSSFGLPLRRHRMFESNVHLSAPPCNHHWQKHKRYWTGWRPKGEVVKATVVQVYGNAGGRHEWPEAMGIDWMTPAEMCEAVPPAYTEWLGRQLVRFVELRQHEAQAA